MDQIPIIEEALKTNIYILNIRDLPMFSKDMHLYNSLMYMNNDQVYDNQYWLLYDDVHEHFHVSTNIKKNLQVKHFCNKCFKTFKLEQTFNKHLHNGICNNELDGEVKTEISTNSKTQ